MALVLYTGNPAGLHGDPGATARHRFVPYDAGTDSLGEAAAFIADYQAPNLVATLQQVSAADKQLSILVVAPPQELDAARLAIRFMPFLSAYVVVLPSDDRLPQAIETAVAHTRQRRNYRRIQAGAAAATAPAATTPVRLEFLGSFLNQAPIAAFITDREGRILALNKKAQRLFRLEQSAASGLALPDFFPQGLPQAQPAESSGMMVIAWQDRFLELTSSDILNEEGKVVRMLLFNDITELKESEQRIHTILEALPQLAWTTDAEGAMSYATQEWYRYTGHAAAQGLSPDSWLRYLHPEERVPVAAEWERAQAAGQPFHQEARYLRSDGRYRWHLLRATAMLSASGDVSFRAFIGTDIEQQKSAARQLEQQVQERTEELAATVEELRTTNEELAGANQELQHSNEELAQYAYVASHDLQEPLRKIRVFSGLLAANKEVPASARPTVEKISASAERMSLLIQNLLEFSRLLKSDELMCPVSLAETVQAVWTDFELVAAEKSATMRVGELPVIQAVSLQMNQLFYNLVNNALKFCEPGIAPHIEITSRPATADDVRKYLSKPFIPGRYHHIQLRDNGIGFEAQYADRIFEVFKRLHGREAYAGSGIGLALCRRIVDNHQGVLFAESEIGKGAVFHIILPERQQPGDKGRSLPE